MKTTGQIDDSFDEQQSIRVIKEMIQVSRKRLKNDGILFIVWGWISFISYISEYLCQTIPHIYFYSEAKHYFSVVAPIFGLLFTIGYLYQKSRVMTTHFNQTIRHVWFSSIGAMVLINLIQQNVLHKVMFELQLPIFMVLIAFAIVITGSIIRHKIIIWGGIVFGLLAYLASFFDFKTQLLVESIAWFMAFVVPGHLMYAKRNE